MAETHFRVNSKGVAYPVDRWHEAERCKLVEYINQRLPAVVIAELLERSENSVRSYCASHDMSLPRKTAIQEPSWCTEEE